MGSNKQLVRIFIVLAVLLVAGIGYLYLQIRTAGDFWPHENAPGTLTYDVNQLRREVARLEQEANQIPAAQEKLAAIRVEHDLATRVLPRESSPDQLIAAIRTKALQAGVVPDKLTPTVGARAGGGRGGNTGPFEEWGFTLNIRGSYDQIATFINRMEEFESNEPSRTGSEKRFFKVSDIDITAEENGLGNLDPTRPTETKGHVCVLNMQTYRFTGEE